jgi:hypothetical protein
VEIGGYHRTWKAEDIESLRAALAWRDLKGGAIFWLGDGHGEYPQLAIRISGDFADIHYFPEEGHPGFRSLGGEGLPKGGMTTFIYDGSDPAEGEDTPNEFVVSPAVVWLVAKEFFLSKRMSNAVSWFEL